MKKILTRKHLLFLICFLLNQILNAQVKTIIYESSIPANKIMPKLFDASEVVFTAPTEFNDVLKEQKFKQADKNSEYDNKFAIPKLVEIDFFKESKVIEIDNYLYYLLNVTAEGAINISLQFKEFHLSKNCILSIHNKNELTDSITSKENNENNLWATRVFQGAKLNLILKIPISEKGLSNFKISQASFGYKKFGGEYFGTPGTSASCNINVQCPQGNTWQNERNAVAIMLVADGAGTCTGSLINNTCNVNTPYVLTANHCLSGNLNNWVFQYQYFSTTCTPNTGGREDIQFNGCSLKANSANSDFALVQMNQTPSASTGVAYAGWNRSATPAINTVEIHHPASDLMKISLDANPAVAISWPGITGLTHWRAHFQQGTVQPGSSGSPLFDQNHRIIGQCHGDQNNAGNYCAQRISECGRFDRSWTGGGTNSTRLSNWLDPNNTGAITTNTTNISSLQPATVSLSITGSSSFCNGSSTYTVSGVPIGSNIQWSSSNTNIATVTPNGTNSALVTKNGNGEVFITVNLVGCVGGTATTRIYVGTLQSPSQLYINGTAYNSFSNICLPRIAQYTISIDPVQDATSYYWSIGQPYAVSFDNGQGTNSIETTVFGSPGNSLSFSVQPENGCGRGGGLIVNGQVCGTNGGGLENESFRISPNPASSIIKVEALSNKNEIKEIRILNKLGNVVKSTKYAKGNAIINLDISSIPNDIYFIEIFDGFKWTRKQISKL